MAKKSKKAMNDTVKLYLWLAGLVVVIAGGAAFFFSAYSASEAWWKVGTMLAIVGGAMCFGPFLLYHVRKK